MAWGYNPATDRNLGAYHFLTKTASGRKIGTALRDVFGSLHMKPQWGGALSVPRLAQMVHQDKHHMVFIF